MSFKIIKQGTLRCFWHSHVRCTRVFMGAALLARLSWLWNSTDAFKEPGRERQFNGEICRCDLFLMIHIKKTRKMQAELFIQFPYSKLYQLSVHIAMHFNSVLVRSFKAIHAIWTDHSMCSPVWIKANNYSFLGHSLNDVVLNDNWVCTFTGNTYC